MIRILLAFVIALCLSTAAARAERIVLAAGGKPAATIVTPAKAEARVAAAAADLQRYIERICGVKLPIRPDGKRVEGTGLYVGRCEPTTDADLPGATRNPETYAIRVREGSLFFIGRWPTPAAFAVASFLEDNLGVRWFAPGELWEYVPQGTPGELAVQVSEVEKTPSFSPRVWSGHEWFPEWKAWNLRNKTVLSEVVPRRQFQNYLHRVFPPEKYGKTHPEYYPLINGKRWIPTDADRYWRPCESNPDVLRLTVDYARQWLDSHPTIDSFSLGMDDISHLCSCPSCRAMDPRPDSYEKRQFSDRHYKFVNAVAREVKKTHPDRYVGTLIYNIARELPETVPQLEDNVFGFITETSALWWQEGRKAADHELTRQWAKRCKHLSRYDYYGMGCLTPRFYPHAMAEQLKFDKSLGVEGMYTEIYTFLPHTAPMIWAFARLQWDHTLDIDRLLDEFYAKMYGDAAGPMKDYFALLERSWSTPRPGRTGWTHRNLVMQALAMSREDVDEGFRLLDKATSGSRDPKVRQRIDVHRGALEYAGYVICPYGFSQELMRMPVSDEASADKALTLIEQLDQLAVKRTESWPAAAKRDDLLGETLRGLGNKMGYLPTGQIAAVEHGATLGVMKVLAWYTQHAPQKLDSVAERLTRFGRGSGGTIVQAFLWLQKNKPDNCLGNGDFEATPAKQQWSTWTRVTGTQFDALAGKGRNGSAAVAIGGAEAACYMQTVPAKPGEKYLCVAWAKPDPATPEGDGKLTVRLRNRKGSWHPRRDLEPSVAMIGGQSDWQPLAVLITVPEDGGALVVMLGADGQAPNARVLFDDVTLYRLP